MGQGIDTPGPPAFTSLPAEDVATDRPVEQFPIDGERRGFTQTRHPTVRNWRSLGAPPAFGAPLYIDRVALHVIPLAFQPRPVGYGQKLFGRIPGQPVPSGCPSAEED